MHPLRAYSLSVPCAEHATVRSSLVCAPHAASCVHEWVGLIPYAPYAHTGKDSTKAGGLAGGEGGPAPICARMTGLDSI